MSDALPMNAAQTDDDGTANNTVDNTAESAVGTAAKHAAHETVLVACLCAGWCGTCTSYRNTLAAIAQEHPELRFAWIDIEDDSDALGEATLDIENFPTLMLLRGGRPLFHGTVLPHAATLERMLEALADGSLAAGDAAQVPQAMAAAVWRLGPQRPV